MRKTVQIQNELRKTFPAITINSTQAEQIERYIKFLIQWNKKINLTAIRNENQIFIKHILDSLVICQLADVVSSPSLKLGKTLDMGSGAGLPSIVLAIVDPELEIFSVDKVKKKITFQEFIKAQLQLKNFTPLAARLQSLATSVQHNQVYTTVVCRAFDQLTGIFELALDFLQPQGQLILWKGKNWEKEWDCCPEKLKAKFFLHKEHPYELGTTAIGGTLLLFKKPSNSPLLADGLQKRA